MANATLVAAPAPTPVVPPAESFQAAPTPAPSTKAKKPKHGINVAYVGIVIGRYGKDGNITEEVIQLDPDIHTVTKAVIKEETKTRQLKEDGQLVGIEPTGEKKLTLELAYHVD